jgi:iron-sulfur cluster repair protein YtfE (RIC family)
MYTQSLIPPGMTVSRTIRLFPVTVTIFNAFGIDACCGGEVSIEEAARREGADPIALVGALNRAAEDAH